MPLINKIMGSVSVYWPISDSMTVLIPQWSKAVEHQMLQLILIFGAWGPRNMHNLYYVCAGPYLTFFSEGANCTAHRRRRCAEPRSGNQSVRSAENFF